MIFVFLVSAFLLIFLILLKVWELRIQKKFWFSRLLSSQDFRMKLFIAFLNSKLVALRIKSEHFIYAHLPKLLRKSVRHSKNFTVENLVKIQDNIRGKYKKFSSPKPTSSYLREISKPKSEGKKIKDHLQL